MYISAFGGTMRNIAVCLLLLSGLCRAQSAQGEYSINVHVVSPHWIVMPSSIGTMAAQDLNVVIDGKKYELAAEAKGKIALLALGDYKAKLVEDIHKSSYESSQTYEFQFSDGKTRKFVVVGQNE
jgi:hypothetical protein